MFNNGDKVKLNNEGMQLVQKEHSCGYCDGPIPESLEGEVIGRDHFLLVRLPLYRRSMADGLTNVWRFSKNELTH